MSVNLNRDGEIPHHRRVWDIPVRVTHALLIACVAGAWLTRDARQADLHEVFGYVALGLVAFRVVWGLAGTRHARFARFAYGPRAVIGYLAAAVRGHPLHFTGHNPAGSWAVFTLLLLLLGTTLTGVATLGGVHGDGPLAGLVSFVNADRIRGWHDWLAWAMLGMALFHLVGVVWGSWLHRENLAKAMVTGVKASYDDPPTDAPPFTSLGLVLVAVTAAFAGYYLAVLVPSDVVRRKATQAAWKESTKAQLWNAECGSCHLAYSPALLPPRSWERIFREQGDHFGEDLGLGDDKVAHLRAYVFATPAPGWAAWKLATATSLGEAPLRVTESPYWRHVHHEVAEPDFKPPSASGKHDCEACHADALSGIFHPRMIHIPKSGVTP